jgi:hypothetical protein
VPPAKATSDPSNQIGQADLQPRPATVSFVTTEHVTQALSQVQGGHRLLRQQAGVCCCEELLFYVKAGPAGGRLRRPSSRRQRHNGHREPALPCTPGGAKAAASQAQPLGLRLYLPSVVRRELRLRPQSDE